MPLRCEIEVLDWWEYSLGQLSEALDKMQQAFRNTSEALHSWLEDNPDAFGAYFCAHTWLTGDEE